jgi:hypothetical protein
MHDSTAQRQAHGPSYGELKARIAKLEAALRAVNATLRAVVQRNPVNDGNVGGYMGDWDAIHHTVEVIDAALGSSVERGSKDG